MVSFIRQYQYNSDMAPDRMQLQNMGKKGHESFKEYAQRNAPGLLRDKHMLRSSRILRKMEVEET